MDSHKIQIIALLVLALFIHFFAIPYFLQEKDTPLVEESPEIKVNPFEELVLEASSAVVFDINKNKTIYSLNPTAQLPLASLTKLMTAYVADKVIGQDEILSISPDAIKNEGDQGLIAWERFRSGDLIDLTLLSSSNDGASALASAVTPFSTSSITEIMNEEAQKLNLKQTYFINSTGLDLEDGFVGGAYGSAKDVALFLDYLVEKNIDILEVTTSENITVNSLNGFSHNFKNTNKILEELPWLLASKTGFTDLAGGNLAIVFDAGLGKPFAVVVLGSTKEDRFEDVKRLVNTTFEFMNVGE